MISREWLYNIGQFIVVSAIVGFGVAHTRGYIPHKTPETSYVVEERSTEKTPQNYENSDEKGKELKRKIEGINLGTKKLYHDRSMLSFAEDLDGLKAIALMINGYDFFDKWWETTSESEQDEYHKTMDAIRDESNERWDKFMASEGDIDENFYLIYDPMPDALQKYAQREVKAFRINHREDFPPFLYY